MNNDFIFESFRKIPRFSRDIIITEKIDGTNAQIFISEEGELLVGSRNRYITVDDDNYGFAKWVEQNKEEILKLGPGRHFGEWWGNGIQRGYNLPKGEKRFSLFNTDRWVLHGQTPQLRSTEYSPVEKYQEVLPQCIGLVPVLYKGLINTNIIEIILQKLIEDGSSASKGFMNPEGIVIFHTAGNYYFKKTIKDDENPKSKIKIEKRCLSCKRFFTETEVESGIFCCIACEFGY